MNILLLKKKKKMVITITAYTDWRLYNSSSISQVKNFTHELRVGTQPRVRVVIKVNYSTKPGHKSKTKFLMSIATNFKFFNYLR